jgi:hypothetical protein
MSELETNAFAGRTEAPAESDLTQALGSAKPLWDQLLAEVAEKQGAKALEWKSYAVKHGWSLRVLRGKRTIMWLTPRRGDFGVTFILGDKAAEAARHGGLSAKLLTAVEEAQRFTEGRCVRLSVRHAKDLPGVLKLAAIKAAN